MLASADVEAVRGEMIVHRVEVRQGEFKGEMMERAARFGAGEGRRIGGERYEHDELRHRLCGITRAEKDGAKLRLRNERQPERLPIEAQRCIEVMYRQHNFREAPDHRHCRVSFPHIRTAIVSYAIRNRLYLFRFPLPFREGG